MIAWLAPLDAPAGVLSAPAVDRVLTGWLDTARRPRPDARRVDPRVLDLDGAPAHLSLLWPDRDALLLFNGHFRPLSRTVHLAVAGGLLGRCRSLAGPWQERYASAPWPAGALHAARRPPGLSR